MSLVRELRRDRGQRAGARLLAGQAVRVRRDDQHRCAERRGGLELLGHRRGVVLRVLERRQVAARVLLAREQDDLDRVPARGCGVDHAAQLELDAHVGRRGV